MAEKLGCIKLIRCPKCDKEFVYNPYSVYKIYYKGHLSYYCSYSCFRKDQKMVEEEKRTRHSAYNRYAGVDKLTGDK